MRFSFGIKALHIVHQKSKVLEYQADKDSVVVYYSTAGFLGQWGSKKVASQMHPYITEFDFGKTEPSVVMKLKGTFGYQAFPVSLEKAMGTAK